MKKILILAALLLTKVSFAQMSEVRGHIKIDHRKDISLFRIEDGHTELMAITDIGEDGSFGFLFTPSNEGFYVVGYDSRAGGEQFPVYLKKGDKVSLAIDGKRMQFVGKQTPENTIVSAWTNLTQELKVKSIYFSEPPLSSFHDFFPELTKVAAQADGFRKTIKTKNENFNRLMTAVTYLDLDLYALNHIRTPRTEWPTEKDYVPYYKDIVVENKFKSDEILSTAYGEKLMGLYADFVAKKSPVLDNNLNYFSSDRQKGVYVLKITAPFIQSYQQYENMMGKYAKYFKSPTLKKRVDELGKKVYVTTPGGTAVNFSFADKNGKMVSLSDLKGKVVVMDLWATWCAPCKKEIPYLKKLEEELRDKDVVFVSISVDELKDKERWLKMVEDMKLSGLQLFANGFMNKVTELYKITTIPRFMVIDREGKIVDPNSPRPSDPKLKALLEKELLKETVKAK